MKGENDNLIEISERPANTVTKTLFKTPPQAPTAVITDYGGSRCVGTRCLCPAGPENQDKIGLPKTRSDTPLTTGTTNKSCLGAVPTPQPALHRGNNPTVPTRSTTQLPPELQHQRALQAATLPVPQKHSLYIVMWEGTPMLAHWCTGP